MIPHQSHVVTDDDDNNLFVVRCTCGDLLGRVDSMELAMDILMDHAAEKGFESGYETALEVVGPS